VKWDSCTGLAEALYAQSAELEDPLLMYLAVRKFYGDRCGPATRAEVAEENASNYAWLRRNRDPSVVHSPRWKWLYYVDSTVQRFFLAGGGQLNVLNLTMALRLNVDAHLWHLEHGLGTDPWDDRRAGWIDVLGRMLLGLGVPPPVREVLEASMAVSVPVALGQLIRRRRVKEGLSQAELGRRVGASRSTVARWESGQSRPLPAHRKALVRVLGGMASDY
jgi:DNA-binding XRE family transcriptional regulator